MESFNLSIYFESMREFAKYFNKKNIKIKETMNPQDALLKDYQKLTDFVIVFNILNVITMMIILHYINLPFKRRSYFFRFHFKN